MTRRPQIAVCGPGEAAGEVLATAADLGRALVDEGWRVVCGGRGGVMAAVGQGARSSARWSGGDVVGILPGTDPAAANAYVDVVLPTGLGHARNALVVGAADVVVAMGGRSGTLSEIALAWTLGKPVVALCPPAWSSAHGGWASRLAGAPVDDRRDEPVHPATSVPEVVQAVRALLG